MDSKEKYKIKIFRRNRKIDLLPRKLHIIYMSSIIIIGLIGTIELMIKWNFENRYNEYNTFIWIYVGIIILFIACLDIKGEWENSIPMLEEAQSLKFKSSEFKEAQSFGLKVSETIRERAKKNKYDTNYMYTNSLFNLIACKTNTIIARTISIITGIIVLFYFYKLFIYQI